MDLHALLVSKYFITLVSNQFSLHIPLFWSPAYLQDNRELEITFPWGGPFYGLELAVQAVSPLLCGWFPFLAPAAVGSLFLVRFVI